jgi:hypothetical protein
VNKQFDTTGNMTTGIKLDYNKKWKPPTLRIELTTLRIELTTSQTNLKIILLRAASVNLLSVSNSFVGDKSKMEPILKGN